MIQKIIKFKPWLIVLLLMIIIFIFSNMNTYQSNGKSQYLINKMVTITSTIANKIGLLDTKLTEEEIDKLTISLNLPLRKCTHFTIYLILSLLIIYALKYTNIKKKELLTILICFLYAITDEYHQTFIAGRTGQFSDVIIDTLGTITAIIIYKKIIKR